MLNRRQFLRAASVATGACVFNMVGCSGERSVNQKSSKKPNIIFVLADDLGYGDLGCYGQKMIQTPNIDRMAQEGMRFTDHYAGSTVCAPSRCCLMTGKHAGHARIRSNARFPLRPEDRTVAELLKKAGYTTGIIGKWGLGQESSTGTPNNKGFDYWFGYLDQGHAHNYYPEFLWENEKKVPLDNKVTHFKDTIKGLATVKKDYSHDLFTDHALDFVRQNKNNPFFLYLAYTIPHANNQAIALGAEHGMEVPDYGIYNDKPWPDAQKGHAAMISRLDRDMGRIRKKLAKSGIEKDTLIIFTSDNGPHKEGGARPDFFNSQGQLRGIKRDLYEGGIRVPFIACWPEKIASASTSDHVSAFWDFLPTCCELANVSYPANVDGISMVPTLLDKPEKQKKHKCLYWEFYEQGGKKAVRFGKYKAVMLKVSTDANGHVELYNLQRDISEQNDIADQNPELVAMARELFASEHKPSKLWSF